MVFTSPEEGSTLHGTVQTIALTYDDPSGVAPGSFRLLVNGQDLSSQLSAGERGAQGTVTLAAGALTLVARVEDTAGNPAEATLHVTVRPELEEVVTPVSETAVTPFIEATAFLYTGPHAIQTGVAEGTIDPKRVAVLRGHVKGREGNPLVGVKVSVLGHPEFGATLTRANGMFDMAVNGGVPLTLQYELAGYMPSQRQEQPAWQNYAWLEDVVLVGADAQVTPVQFGGGSTGMQVAQGAPVTDADGTRRATLLFPPNTQVSMELPDGSTQTLSTGHVRATEYTVGERGPDAMPGDLPPTSGYTYAVELSVDEAQAAGAVEVRFTQPVPLYVDNFLNFPVGSVVPAGYYDRRSGVWKPSDNGRVVKILGINANVAVLDVNGDGIADGPDVLVPLGILDDELQQLGRLYPAGKTLWRTPIVHFTPWDCNWPYGPPLDAEAPIQSPPQAEKPEEKPDAVCGSIIECQTQTLGEAIELVGAPFGLHYRSDRVPGRKTNYRLKVPLSGASLPASLRRMVLEVEIAGQRFTHTFPAAVNQQYTFEWDGKDAYGRVLQGEWPAKVRVGYVYSLIYQQPAEFGQAFGRISGIPFTAAQDTREMTLWQDWESSLGTFKSSSQGLGGWTLDVQHAYDAMGKVLYLGYGQRRSSLDLNQRVITTVAGTGVPGSGGDGGPATQSQLLSPEGIAVGRDGSLFIVDSANHRIRKVSPAGTITTVAGTGVPGYSGDGGSATQAQFRSPQDIAVDAENNLFIVDTGNFSIRKVNSQGIITTVVGTGNRGYSGNGGPATQARLYGPQGIALGSDGSLFIADDHRIRKVGPDGVITTAVGKCASGFSGDGGSATQARLNLPQKIALDSAGNLWIADTGNHRVRKVSPHGIITTVAGTSSPGYSGDGGPATQARLLEPRGIAVDLSGTLFIADAGNHRIRKVSPDGIITTVTGTGFPASGGSGGPVAQAQVHTPRGLALSPEGSLFISEWSGQRIRKVSSSLPGFGSEDLIIPSEDGGEVYVFNSSGRHLRTLDALTKSVRFEFGYDEAGRLMTVKDEDGLISRVERDASGKPLTIVAPHGQRTTLGLDGNGYLSSVTNPASETIELAHTAGGLLTSLKDPRGGLHTFEYEPDGRLKKDNQPGGGFKALARTETANGYNVAVSTAMGRTTTYAVQNLSSGEQQRTLTGAAGQVSTTLRNSNGTTAVTAADGTLVTTVEGPDARFGMQVPLVSSQTVKLPSGLTQNFSHSRTVTLTNPQDVLSLSTLTDVLTVNGLTTTLTYEASTRKLTQQSPMRKQVTTTYDDKGKVVKVEVPGILPVTYDYDTEGQLRLLAQGTRSSTFTYKPEGYLNTVTDALGRTASFSYDLAGRVRGQALPGNRQVNFDYDANGNLKTLVPSGQPAHSFTYTPTDAEEDYTPPSLTGVPRVHTHSEYNVDRQWKQSTYPDGADVQAFYEDNATSKKGRLQILTATPPSSSRYSARTLQAVYYPVSGYLQSLTDSQGASLNYVYDGALLKQVTWSTGVSGSVSYNYDAFFRPFSLSINGANPVVYAYDEDGLMKQAGSMVLVRSPTNGVLTDTTLGQVSTTIVPNAYGEIESLSTSWGSVSLYSVQLRRDAVGRIDRKFETVQGTTHTYVYTYDAAGRLEDLQEDGTVISHATYDNGGAGNGNRTALVVGGVTRTASYDAQDRLLTFGNATYTYGPSGDLQSKQVGTQSTTYVYDSLGNLHSATLPNGTRIAYVVDAQSRRVGKMVNGALTQGFLYDGQLRVIAELNSSNQVVSRFVYATQGHSPDYMVKGGTTYRIISDHLGSPRLVVDIANGNVAQRLDYDVWGNVLADSNPGFQPFGFAGGLYDRDTKLTRFGARDYDAETGRWTTKDPIRFAGGDTNFYVYVANQPHMHVDPSGLFAVPIGAIVAAVGIVIAKDLHYNRNQYNRVVSYEFASKSWIPVPADKAVYHQHGLGNERNKKFISPNGHCEVVFRDGQLVTDPANIGTYNFGSDQGSALHLLLDVVPYYFWGNSPDDPTPFPDRVLGPRGAKELKDWGRSWIPEELWR
ncbi:RHS repeat-associated core domain-containing protein [Hyalangium minutum]|uniref:NHL domain-containing protein n=1 Tax=Hyalangium minutum TaxID=394096 RepID=UPI001470610B|nr:RHS repeat-associated core domain-containing protein [Hyalangium minutum]